MSREREEKNNKLLVIIAISVIFSIIYELILKFAMKKNDVIYIYNIIIESFIIFFILLHFTVGFKKLYDYIINNRFKIAFILVVIFTIIGILQNINDFKNWMTSFDSPLNIWWNIKFYALILTSFELFLLITKNRYMACIGTILIIFSGCIVWNFNIATQIILGELIVLLVNKFFDEKKSKNIFIYSAIIGILIATYININTSIAIAFGYPFLAIIIWTIIINKENIKISSAVKLLCLTCFIVIVASLLLRGKFVTKANYHLKNDSEPNYLFSYVYNILLPFKALAAKQDFGSFLSMFPVPMIIALFYIFKYEKHSEFLLPLAITSVIETIFCTSGFPKIIKLLLLFNNVNIVHVAMAVNYTSLIMAFYMIANINEKIFSVKAAMRITVIVCCFICVFAKIPSVLGNRWYLTIYVVELASTIFLFLNFEDKKYKKVLLSLLIIFTLIGGVPINKITARTVESEKISDEVIIEK